MKHNSVVLLVPPVGYIGLWILGSALFLLYFKVFGISMESEYTQMIQAPPPVLSIVTVPICSFASFFLTSRIISRKAPMAIRLQSVALLAVGSVVFTIVCDLLTTVVAERMNILLFPVNLMYLLAWLVIIPAVLLGGYRKAEG